MLKFGIFFAFAVPNNDHSQFMCLYDVFAIIKIQRKQNGIV